MAELVRVEGLPADYEVACTSDWHVGAKAHNERALDALVAWVGAKRNRYLDFGGDAVEGKPVGSPHFDPDGLREGQVNIEQQFAAVVEKVRPIKSRILAWRKGNHDLYLSRDIDVVRRMVCEPLGILGRMGGYQTWVDLGTFRLFGYHGRATMPRGAKDPIQRDANQRAWLVNRLSALAGDCAVMLMGHVHALLVQPPVEEYALLTGPDRVEARYFLEPAAKVAELEFLPVKSRWYGCTGTLRRSGGFGFTDYSEVAGYPPAPIGWLTLTVRGGRPVNLSKVVV